MEVSRASNPDTNDGKCSDQAGNPGRLSWKLRAEAESFPCPTKPQSRACLRWATSWPRRRRTSSIWRTCASLLGAMNHPERGFPSVLIAGTNGKGLDGGDAGFHSAASGFEDRTLHFAASDADQRTHPHQWQRKSVTTILPRCTAKSIA